MRQYGLYFIRLSYPLADYSLSQNAFFSKKWQSPPFQHQATVYLAIKMAKNKMPIKFTLYQSFCDISHTLVEFK
ncbi:hypothetical protein BN440_3078 [Erwinia amylovora MR1]|nr:hypothetical protein BN440_3078 [Erwinia amylovora MR1]